MNENKSVVEIWSIECSSVLVLHKLVVKLGHLFGEELDRGSSNFKKDGKFDEEY